MLDLSKKGFMNDEDIRLKSPSVFTQNLQVRFPNIILIFLQLKLSMI